MYSYYYHILRKDTSQIKKLLLNELYTGQNYSVTKNMSKVNGEEIKQFEFDVDNRLFTCVCIFKILLSKTESINIL